MAANDSNIPRFLDVTKLNPPVAFTCDVHGDRKIVMQFNPPLPTLRCRSLTRTGCAAVIASRRRSRRGSGALSNGRQYQPDLRALA
jgi:hypothetical protein